jgi:uncharacterized protein (TIGR02996 family)
VIPPALLTAILDRPGDDAPRLASADWLDEHAADLPDPRAARDRAELIRVQCELARAEHARVEDGKLLSAGWGCRYGCRACALADRERELLDAPGHGLRNHALWLDGGAGWPTYRRGFVAEVRGQLDWWQQHAPALLAAHPLGRVEASDVPGLVWAVEPPDQESPAWRLRATLSAPRVIAEWVPDGSGGHVATAERPPQQYADVAASPNRGELVRLAERWVRRAVERLRAAAGDRWPGWIGRLAAEQVRRWAESRRRAMAHDDMVDSLGFAFRAVVAGAPMLVDPRVLIRPDVPPADPPTE